jgi:hypothetical protein
MSKFLIVTGLTAALLIAFLIPAGSAAAATVGVYFDRELTQQSTECPNAPAGSVLDTIYVAISGLAEPIEGIEFKVDFPPEIIWLGDVYPGNALMIGQTPYGVSMAFLDPPYSPERLEILKILVLWNCESCYTPDIPISVVAHPATESLRAVTSDLMFEDVVGQTSIVCGWCCSGETPGMDSGMPRTTAMALTHAECVLDCPAGDGGVIIPGDPPGVHHSVDLNDDDIVDLVDFAMFAEVYTSIYDASVDYYCTGNIDLIDFVLFTRHWLHTASVPVRESTWGAVKMRYAD